MIDIRPIISNPVLRAIFMSWYDRKFYLTVLYRVYFKEFLFSKWSSISTLKQTTGDINLWGNCNKKGRERGRKEKTFLIHSTSSCLRLLKDYETLLGIQCTCMPKYTLVFSPKPCQLWKGFPLDRVK